MKKKENIHPKDERIMQAFSSKSAVWKHFPSKLSHSFSHSLFVEISEINKAIWSTVWATLTLFQPLVFGAWLGWG